MAERAYTNPLFPEWDAAAAAAGAAARDRAMDLVQAHAPVTWRAAAEQALRYVAERRARFTTDPVWAVLDDWRIMSPPEPRALGPLMKSAVTWGWCTPTGEWHLSVRPECHRRPIAVYQSYLFQEQTPPRG